jgi:cytochrome P450
MSLHDRAVRRVGAAWRRLLGSPSPVGPLDAVDLLQPDVLQNPYACYAALRESAPVHFLPRRKIWLVVGYEEVLAALRSPRHFSSVQPQPRFDRFLNEVDPPDHTRVRRAIAPYFSAASIDALEAHARASAAGLADALAGRAEVDLVREFTLPYVERVVGAFLGLTPAECEALRARLAQYGEDAQEDRFEALHQWASEQMARAATAPSGSMAGRLFRAQNGAAHTAEEAVGLLKLFWVAGGVTTSRLLPAALLHLLRDPGVRASVESAHARIPALVEEAARLDPPESILWRVAGPDAEIAGVTIPPGAAVRLCVGAANRDPSRFLDPDRVWLERPENPHLTFGSGPHVCPGARLARLMVRVALEALLTTWPGFRAARPLSTVSYVPLPDCRALTALFVSPGRESVR